MSELDEIMKPYIDFKTHCNHRGLPFQQSEINLMSKFEIGLLNYIDKLINEKLNNPTLEQVKQEWEEKGFNVTIDIRFIYIDRQESNNYFIFDRLELRCHSHSGWLNLEINSLITKTLKALEVEDE